MKGDPKSQRRRCYSLALADERLEFLGIERLHRLCPNVAQGRKPREASEHLLFVAAEDENPVARSNRPQLNFNRDSRLFGGLFEHECAGRTIPDGAGALVRET